MKAVKIYRLEDNGNQTEVAVCRLEGGVVSCRGDEAIVEYLKQGVSDYSASEAGKKVTPADGEKFLEQLVNGFRSAYLMAVAEE